jgi:long-chain acyl-CoA synthetase
MLTIADPLRRATQIAAGKTAIISGDASFTFAELADRTARLSGGLKKLGLEKGDRVAIWSNNNHQYVETYVGVPAGGLVVVPLNTRHAEPELTYALKDAQASVLITDREPGGLRDVVDHVIRIGDEYEALLQNAVPDILGDDVTEDNLAGLFYTGGTTGQSKGVMLSHRNLVSNTFHWLSMIPQHEQEVFLIMAPLFHAAGTNNVLGTIWTTGCQVTLESFAPAGALDLIEKYQVTQTLGVPAMLSAIAEEQHANPRQVGSVRSISHGGSPIATEVLRRVSTAFPNADLNEVYGATELSPLATILRNEEKILDQPTARSCGQSCLGVDVRVLSSDGHEVTLGEIGEIVVRGPNVMLGYWNKEEQTNAVLKDGAYWTGDLGYMDAQGLVYLVDRAKDMIVSGGENVYSAEVEEVLYRHPAVLEAAVFGVPDETWGEAVHAAIVLRPEHLNADPGEIIEFCRAHIAGYKIPKGIDLRVEPLPKSGPGKVLKRELRAPYWQGREQAVN